jgi:GNAT superfamily N-acetyltransferase
MMSVRLRSATADDVEGIIEILCREPGAESIAFMGSVELARRYSRGLLEGEGIPNPSRVTVVAESTGRIVGVLQYGVDGGGHRGRLAHLRLLLKLVGPIGLVRRLPKLWGRVHVDIPTPANAFYIATLYVDADCSGEGVGGLLLERAEQEARERGASSMCVVTLSTSGAIPWYEQHGFAQTRTVTHPSYERHLHLEGRVLLEKQLDASDSLA